MSSNARAVTLAATILATCALTGCAGSGAAEVPPADPPATDPGPRAQAQPGVIDEYPGLPAHGAPKVAKPIRDTFRYREDPCAVLDADQLLSAGFIGTGAPRHSATGPACDWQDRSTGANTGIQWLERGGQGLSGVFAGKSTYELFEPMPDINGSPVIAYDVVDAREIGACPLVVGVTEVLAFQVESGQARTDAGRIDACTAAHQIAESMLSTMRDGH